MVDRMARRRCGGQAPAAPPTGWLLPAVAAAALLIGLGLWLGSGAFGGGAAAARAWNEKGSAAAPVVFEEWADFQ